MFVVRFIRATRYLVLIPIVGLAIAAAALFVFGGLGLVRFIIENVVKAQAGQHASILPIYGLLEFVHQFLIGTVLYLTALGLYQLFIHELPLPVWMKTESSEDLETDLIGVTVVVLAIEFLGVVFSEGSKDLLQYGAGIALPIAALALFLGLKLRYGAKRSEAAAPESEPARDV